MQHINPGLIDSFGVESMQLEMQHKSRAYRLWAIEHATRNYHNATCTCEIIGLIDSFGEVSMQLDTILL